MCVFLNYFLLWIVIQSIICHINMCNIYLCHISDIFGWPESLCVIPRWMSRTSWQDLLGSHMFSLANENHVIHRSYRRHTGSEGHDTTTYRCINMVPHNSSQSIFTAVMFTSHHWWEPGRKIMDLTDGLWGCCLFRIFIFLIFSLPSSFFILLSCCFFLLLFLYKKIRYNN